MLDSAFRVEIVSHRVVWVVRGELGLPVRASFERALAQAEILRLPVWLDLSAVNRVGTDAYAMLRLAVDRLWGIGFHLSQCSEEIAVVLGLGGYANPRNGLLAGRFESRDRLLLRRTLMQHMTVEALDHPEILCELLDVAPGGVTLRCTEKVLAGKALDLLIQPGAHVWRVVVRHATRDGLSWRIGCEFRVAGDGRHLLDEIGHMLLPYPPLAVVGSECDLSAASLKLN